MFWWSSPKDPEKYLEPFAQRILEQLQQSQAPWQRTWRPRQAGLPENFSSGQPYTGANGLYLLCWATRHGYSEPHWGTRRQLEAAGGQVRKGERGAPVLDWDFSRVQEAVPEQEETPGREARRPGPIPSSTSSRPKV